MTETKKENNYDLEERTYQFAKKVPLYSYFDHLIIGIWNLFDIWCLEFVILMEVKPIPSTREKIRITTGFSKLKMLD
ncbi:MAG: hypothetical protein ACE5WD_07010 [Candidatus Aminicenantia bacterium]